MKSLQADGFTWWQQQNFLLNNWVNTATVDILYEAEYKELIAAGAMNAPVLFYYK